MNRRTDPWLILTIALLVVFGMVMVFIPCENGISHNEAESATPGDCADGARVVAACLAELANR